MKHDNDNLPAEEWRPVPSKPGIEASSHGRIRRLPHVSTMPKGGTRTYSSEPRFGQITRSAKDARHLYFNMVYSGIGNIKVHAAVCEAFHGPKPHNAKGVRHLNENSLDNRPANLRWDTHVANMNDPDLKEYHCKRPRDIHLSNIPKREKRKGLYDSILDVGLMQLELRSKPANDNSKPVRKAA